MHKWAFLRELMASLGGGDWKPYVYETDPIALDAAGNLTRDFTLSFTDAKAFIWTAGLYKTDLQVVQNGTDIVFGGALIKFDEIGGFGQAGKGSFSLDALFSRGGTSGEPRELPYPVAFKGSTTIAGNLKNKTAGALNITLSFIGVRKY